MGVVWYEHYELGRVHVFTSFQLQLFTSSPSQNARALVFSFRISALASLPRATSIGPCRDWAKGSIRLVKLFRKLPDVDRTDGASQIYDGSFFRTGKMRVVGESRCLSIVWKRMGWMGTSNGWERMGMDGKGWERSIFEALWRWKNPVLRKGFLEAGWQRTNG